MGDFLRRLFDSDFMPHGSCWGWEPWVVWSNVLSDSAIFFSYLVIGGTLLRVAARRADVVSNLVLVLFGAFIVSCGCTHAMEVYNTWHGLFRLSGLTKAVTALISLAAVVPLMRILPKLLAAPPLTEVLAMDAALSAEQREKHRVEGQLRETQDRFQLLVGGIKDYAIYLLDAQGRITSWNPGAERITGYAEHEILGQPCSRFFLEADLAAGLPAEVLRKAAEYGRFEDEGWRVRKDGSRFLANGVITAFYDGQGLVQGFAKVTRDITEQRANQAALQNLAESLEDKVKAQVQELRESEAKLQGFIRHASAAIAFKGLDGRFLLINPRMEARLARPARAILGKRNEDLFEPEVCARIREGDQRVLRLRRDIQMEEPWPHADGTIHQYLTHKFPLVDATGQCWGLGVISTDITERKQADRALLQSQKLESLGVLAGGLAHDFNNLLGAMLGNVELALAETTLAQARPCLETVKGLMDKASGLLRQMLAYAGQGQASVHPLDLNQLVTEMTQLLASSTSKKARIRLDLHPHPLLITADTAQLQQVVMNLVINASEALGEQNGLITIATRPADLTQGEIDAGYEGQPLRPGPHVSLEVTDNGSGMTPDVLRKIFDPFFSTKFAGRGLGLAALHGVVRSHHGGIRVTSEPGRGSTFKLLFPAVEGQPPAPAPEAAAPGPPAGGEGRGATAGVDRLGATVLVVDDEDGMRAVVVKALARAGMRTLEARDGMEALALFRQHRDRIRIILMDLTMPNMDGEEACRELRREGAEVPVLLTSGFNETEALRRFHGLGLAGFIQKPFGLGRLVEAVRRALSA